MQTDYRIDLNEPRERAQARVTGMESSLHHMFDGPLAKLETWLEAKEEGRSILLDGREFVMAEYTVENILSGGIGIAPILIDRRFEFRLVGLGPQDISFAVKAPTEKEQTP